MSSKVLQLGGFKLIVIPGLISFFSILSTEMVLNILPLFTITIGGTPLILGLIVGTSSFALYLLYSIWNWLTMKISTRKSMILYGTLFSNISKPLVSFSPSWFYILGLKSSECIGNCLRSTACDEMISCYEIKLRLDKILEILGIVVGSFLAFLFLFIRWSYIQIIFLSIFPGIIAVILIFFMISDDPAEKFSIRDKEIKNQDNKRFKQNIYLLGLIEIGSLDSLFLIIRTTDFVPSNTLYLIPLFFLISNIIYLLFSSYTRNLSNVKSQKSYIIIGLTLFILIGILFSLPAENSTFSYFLIIFIFLINGFAKAVMIPISSTLFNNTTDQNPSKKVFNSYFLIIGVIIFFKSIFMGFLYQFFSFSVMFIIFSIISFSSLILIISLRY